MIYPVKNVSKAPIDTYIPATAIDGLLFPH